MNLLVARELLCSFFGRSFFKTGRFLSVFSSLPFVFLFYCQCSFAGVVIKIAPIGCQDSSEPTVLFSASDVIVNCGLWERCVFVPLEGSRDSVLLSFVREKDTGIDAGDAGIERCWAYEISVVENGVVVLAYVLPGQKVAVEYFRAMVLMMKLDAFPQYALDSLSEYAHE